MQHVFGFLLGFSMLLLGAACSRTRSEAGAGEGSGKPLIKVRLQTDWFPQAEHGGFYQALAKGYFKEEGLDVELLPGGPGAHIKPKIVGGDAEFGMNPATDILVAADRGLPLVIVGAYLQHDHQALLLHADNPVRRFEDLDGKTIIASPSLVWIQYLQKKYGIKINLQPVPYGLAQFMADARSIRQCIITNEPFLAKQQGVAIRTMPLRDAGYDAYHVLFCRKEFVEKNPALVRAMVRASLRGWKDYIEGDPSPAHQLIRERNQNMSAEFLDYSRSQMIHHQLVSGDSKSGEKIGQFKTARVQELIVLLQGIGMVSKDLSVDQVLRAEESEGL